jgi:ubiquitin-protein ligase
VRLDFITSTLRLESNHISHVEDLVHGLSSALFSACQPLTKTTNRSSSSKLQTMLKVAKPLRKSPPPSCARRKVHLILSFTPVGFLVLTDGWLLDIAELSLPPTMRSHFPDPDDILNFELKIEPDEGMHTPLPWRWLEDRPNEESGMYKGGSFKFTFAINNNFPHEPPKVKCTQKIYHPNIDLEGNVCLNILREDWKPVLNLNAVMVGLQVIFSPASEAGKDADIGDIVFVPGTQSRRSTQQGSCRGLTINEGELQEERQTEHAGWLRQECPVRSSLEVMGGSREWRADTVWGLVAGLHSAEMNIDLFLYLSSVFVFWRRSVMHLAVFGVFFLRCLCVFAPGIFSLRCRFRFVDCSSKNLLDCTSQLVEFFVTVCHSFP